LGGNVTVVVATKGSLTCGGNCNLNGKPNQLLFAAMLEDAFTVVACFAVGGLEAAVFATRFHVSDPAVVDGAVVVDGAFVVDVAVIVDSTVVANCVMLVVVQVAVVVVVDEGGTVVVVTVVVAARRTSPPLLVVVTVVVG